VEVANDLTSIKVMMRISLNCIGAGGSAPRFYSLSVQRRGKCYNSLFFSKSYSGPFDGDCQLKGKLATGDEVTCLLDG